MVFRLSMLKYLRLCLAPCEADSFEVGVENISPLGWVHSLVSPSSSVSATLLTAGVLLIL